MGAYIDWIPQHAQTVTSQPKSITINVMDEPTPADTECNGCRYIGKAPYDPPCNKCKRNHMDFYEAE